jgi:hypothetical protein
MGVLGVDKGLILIVLITVIIFFFDCLALEDGTERLSRNVGNYQSVLR